VKSSEATTLIRTPLIEWARPQSWCDLGCGRGTFTTALAHSLARGSIIYAVDFDERALTEIPDHCDGVEIRKIVGDLRSPSLRLPAADGILMANTLHFIQEQQLLLKRLLSVTGLFLIVEYERSKPNRWDLTPSTSRGSANSPPRKGWNEWRNWRLDRRYWWHHVLGARRTHRNIMRKVRCGEIDHYADSRVFRLYKQQLTTDMETARAILSCKLCPSLAFVPPSQVPLRGVLELSCTLSTPINTQRLHGY
jgi:SAM-dependent methyltransferase